MERGLINQCARKCIAIPDGDQSPRVTNGWRENKLIQSSRTKISQIIGVKRFSFSLLHTDNIAATFSNFI
jgi:hypothetical protein